MSELHQVDAAVVGAGASGALVAANLRRIAPPIGSVALIEAGARAARGLAYGTPYGAHLLNVPAARMSALPEDEGHFLRWLQRIVPGANEGTFAPRPLYADYLTDVLDGGAALPSVPLSRVHGTAVGLTRASDRWSVHLHDGRALIARAVVLALGNLAPADPLELGPDAPSQYLRDPWAPGAAVGLPPAASVLLIGTGLTMVDVLLALRVEGHRGPVHALSRRGRLPQSHRDYRPWPLEAVPENLNSPRRAIAWIRGHVAEAEREGRDWRGVIDSLRPHTGRLWRSWSLGQRASFLRHARNAWDVHRHRVAPEDAEQLQSLLTDGTLTVHRGRIVSLRGIERGIEVTWRARGARAEATLTVDRVINCSGPACDYARVDMPLVVQTRQAGWLTPDPLALGIETDDVGCLIGADGKPVSGLYTLGPLRRPALWESTAIPEIRVQAAALAREISRLLNPTP